jgi:hypothetical protein
LSYPGGWRPHLESALCLDLRRMFKLGALRVGCLTSGGWQWTRDGKTIASIGYNANVGTDSGTLTLSYSHRDRDTGEPQDVECVIRLEPLPCHYGGIRWFGLCPYTGRRAVKLYKWSGIPKFCHREAIRPKPTYASQRDGGCDRIMRQRWAIRRKLGDDFTDLFGPPIRPKGVRRRTFERYAARDAELANRERVFMGRLLGRLGGAEARDLAREWRL